MPRIYQPIPLSPNTTVRLDEKASHHLARVLRASVGEALTLFNGQGGEYTAIITQIDKKAVQVQLNDFNPREAESPLNIHLAQGLARGEKMDYIIQKAVELGVKKVIPLITERCNVRLEGEREEKRLQHWQSVAISACEQSGRNTLPEVTPPQILKTWLPQAKANQCFVLSPQATPKLTNIDLPSDAIVILLIGPEGGLSDQEIAAAINQGFQPLNLGPRILRTETAPLAAITLLQSVYGDMK
jgi:16S rRNA (uracil1498-N3)-methyltransferase